ncbi:hypothetical protein [Clostridium sp. JN-9]|uniref:hypothetical protein n=1 Tax=Clostridium sp. JN-9 TaxID=2507159 RepID=UPI000FFE2251|nr:hypothetical protein [Clostridium sp. JN-9]QAT39578.1 hypothetical protein EQM05_04545 [Clostridium sp. JN-9]
MKYTRFDLKKKSNSGRFVWWVLCILIAAFILGTIISKVISKEAWPKSILNLKQNNIESKNQQQVTKKNVKYIAVQGGMYAKKENVENEKKLLQGFGMPFEITDGNNTRVFIGIYDETGAEGIIKTLNTNNVANSKMIFELNVSDLCDAEISEIINADLQIINRFSDKEVKGYYTEELKKWCSQLKAVDKNSKNISVLNELKAYVNSMPEEIKKDKIEENYIKIYTILKKVKTNN